MNGFNKNLSLLFVVTIAVSSLIQAQSACAQSISKSSIPSFTVSLVAHPYDVPATTTTTIDQYTGEEIVTTTPGYHVENKSIEIKISNLHFAAYTDADGNAVNLYYNVRVKGHYSDGEGGNVVYPESQYTDIFGYATIPAVQSSSGYTIISISADYDDGAKVDFQVQTLEGYFTRVSPYLVMDYYTWIFTGEYGSWSETQTLTIGTASQSTATPTMQPSQSAATPTYTASTTQNQTSTPIQFLAGFEWQTIVIVVLVVAVSVMAIGMITLWRRTPCKKVVAG